MRFLQDLSPEQRARLNSIVGILILVLLFFLFMKSGLRERVSLENADDLARSPWTAVVIVTAMTGAWTFALPASVFFFITPLLFAPAAATAIICGGSLAGTTMGYVAARYIGGTWVDKFKAHRVTRFLHRHSSFGSLFAIRIFPSSPHGFINYGAGLVGIPIAKFLSATLIAIGIKAYLYATAISGSVGAASVSAALNWKTVLALVTLAILGLAGHVINRRWKKLDEIVINNPKA